MHIGDTFKKVRELLGLSQVEMAELLFVKQASVSRIEKYEREPSLKLTRRLATIAKARKLKVNPEDFLI